jgi:hypothetical protein
MSLLGRQRNQQQNFWFLTFNIQANRVAIVNSVITKRFNPCKYWTIMIQPFHKTLKQFCVCLFIASLILWLLFSVVRFSVPLIGVLILELVFFLNCFWWNRSSFCLYFPLPPTVGWGDCWIWTQDCSFAIWCRYQWATTAPWYWNCIPGISISIPTSYITTIRSQ